MESLNERVESQEAIDFGEIRIGDWELDTSDPLSPGYEPPIRIRDIFLGMLYTPIYYIGKLFMRG